ncbi:3-oxo-5-alpha-steroid 4-dehydrogenase-domain-containing protein [Roridomyces roridus]|uniref:3-oxo-5-alpha-steroid 4-dehydrogenase-domain-containing protein n=1 Tax=Roridomyces roridus TaxID=1738132 RepID=A0AAD7BS07_9AGAR|nr:3-oxo-5-alpha-steroid 4-dehydrogenase-domain-containing protein [Roridomyces roridus]
MHAQLLYDGARKWFALASVLVGPLLVVIDAPFGRFTPSSQNSIFLVDGIKSWIVMELVSPICFLNAFFRAPLSTRAAEISLGSPKSILAGAFLVHYLNRALLSPLRTPSRSKSHIIVPFCAVIFNLFNGSLMGTFLSSPAAPTQSAFARPTFWLGLALWAAGFAGNIIHDEILLNIRRNAKTKGKARDSGKPGEHYAIPHGLLYRFISYPNYFCEWVEWIGFALAADPRLFTALTSGHLSLPTWASLRPSAPPAAFLPLLSPPWIFLVSEILLMLPRAYRGHRWYQRKFGDNYPQERKIVIPFVL